MEQEFDFKELFLEEANLRISKLYKDLLSMEKDRGSAEAISSIFRTAHTLKSSAALEGYDEMRDLLHEMESVLAKIQDHKIQMNEQIVDTLFACLDGLREIVTSVEEGQSNPVDILSLVNRLQVLSAGAGETRILGGPLQKPELSLSSAMIERALQQIEKGVSLYEITVIFEDEDTMRQTKAYLIYNNCLEVGEIINVTPRLEELESAQTPVNRLRLFTLSSRSGQEIRRVLDPGGLKAIDLSQIRKENLQKMLDEKKIAKIEKAVEELDRGEFRSSVRVEPDQLDEFIRQLKELNIIRVRLAEAISDYRKNGATGDLIVRLEEALSILMENINQLAKTALYFISQPLNMIFKRLEGLVRYLSRQKNKEIIFKTSRKTIMLDKNAVDKIGEALLHIIRNSVDHGIEHPDERGRMGKPRGGEIALLAYAEGKDLVIQVTDDGRGFNIPLIKGTAIEKGIISSEEAEKMSDKEAIDLIFRPGFSTKRDADITSGRGIGMDAALEVVEEMTGSLDCWFKKDKGVRITIRIPLTVCQKKQREIMEALN